MRAKRLLAGLFVLLTALTGTATTASAGEAEHCVLSLTSGETTCYTSAQEAERGANSVEALVMRIYPDINFGGDPLLVTASSTCTTAYDNELNKKDPYLPVSNQISSWETFDTCRVRFWDDFNYGPPMTPLSHVGVDCPDMRNCFGAGNNWNDRASSMALT